MWDELLTPIEEAAEHMHVWALAELEGDSLAPISYELVGAARDLADLLGVRAEAVLVGKDVERLAEELMWRGADTVYVLEDEGLAQYRTEAYAQVLAELVSEKRPEILLFGATDIGQDLAPRLAQRLETGLLSDCSKVEVDQAERVLLGTRPTYDGELMVTTACPQKRPQMATVRPGAVEPFSSEHCENGRGGENAGVVAGGQYQSQGGRGGGGGSRAQFAEGEGGCGGGQRSGQRRGFSTAGRAGSGFGSFCRSLSGGLR